MAASTSSSGPVYSTVAPPLPAYHELKKQKYVRIQKDFQDLLCTVEKVNEIATFQEVLAVLQKYIMGRKLYNLKNPIQICCKGDALSKVFGRTEFPIYDIRQNLLQLLTPVGDTPHGSCSAEQQEASKRKAEENLEAELNKRGRQSSPDIPYEVLQEIQDILSDSDSCFSVEETLEYEVESNFSDSSDVPWSSENDDSDNEMQTFGSAVIQILCKTDSDKEFWGDKSSDDEYNSDIELAQFDKWRCNECNKFNHPETGFCLGCMRTRPEWVNIKRPMRRHIPDSQRRDSRTKRKKQKSASHENTKNTEEIPFAIESSCPSSSSQGSQESLPADAKLCLLCCSNERDASIIHGKYAHDVVCYPCGKKLRRTTNRCPVCRRTIERIVRTLD